MHFGVSQILFAVSALCFAVSLAGIPGAVPLHSVGLFFLALGLAFEGR